MQEIPTTPRRIPAVMPMVGLLVAGEAGEVVGMKNVEVGRGAKVVGDVEVVL
jgi:hypothetical protein